MNKEHKWLVIRTKENQEKRALINLSNQGYSSYCPMVPGKTNVPLFPSYVFVKYESDLKTIQYTFGVRDLVRFGNNIATLDGSVIDNLRFNEKKREEILSTVKPLKRGDRVSVLDGPFKQLEGVFKCRDGGHRCVILLDFLSKNTPVSISLKEIKSAY